MERNHHSTHPSLTAEEISVAVRERLKRYEGLNLFEQFAMFMGMAQLVEISLKQLLHRKCGMRFEDMERWTLGQVARSLKECGLRADFIGLLDGVVSHRNHIAHSLLASQIMLHSLGAGDARFEIRILERGIYELEQLWFLYEWTEEHNAWV
jgi:hypothetical protein